MPIKILRVSQFDDAPIGDEFEFREVRKPIDGRNTLAWDVVPISPYPIAIEGEGIPEDAAIIGATSHLFFDTNDLALKVESKDYPGNIEGMPMLIERAPADIRRKAVI